MVLTGCCGDGAAREQERRRRAPLKGKTKCPAPHQVPALHLSSSLSHPCWKENSCGHHPPCRTKVLGSFTSCLCDLQKITVNLRVDVGEEKCSLQTQVWHSPPKSHHVLLLSVENHRRHRVESFSGTQRFLQRLLCSSQLRN